MYCVGSVQDREAFCGSQIRFIFAKRSKLLRYNIFIFHSLVLIEQKITTCKSLSYVFEKRQYVSINTSYQHSKSFNQVGNIFMHQAMFHITAKSAALQKQANCTNSWPLWRAVTYLEQKCWKLQLETGDCDHVLFLH